MNRTYRAISAAARVLVRAYFRRVEVTGLENLPDTGGGILVSWHPNGLIDPGLIFTHFPPWSLAPETACSVARPGQSCAPWAPSPSTGSWMAGTEARRRANTRSLDAMAQAVVEGRWSCLFPEGDSHDAPHLLDLKTGAARFYFRAQELSGGGQPPPVIIPVGLHYDDKHAFRSHALVTFHPPLSVPALLDAPPPAEPAPAPAPAAPRPGPRPSGAVPTAQGSSGPSRRSCTPRRAGRCTS